jgi:sec-independent protein translocase protein TatA
VIPGGDGLRRGGMNLGGPEMLIVLVVVLLLFGSKKVPELARSLGKAQKEFKEGLTDGPKES